MTTSSTTRAPVRRTRRTVLIVALSALLLVGVGIGAVSLASSGDAVVHRSEPVPATVAAAPDVDVDALWNQLATLSAEGRDAVVAGLAPDVLTRLAAYAEELALTAEHD